MTCRTLEVPGGIAIVCSRGQSRGRDCAFCGTFSKSYVLCDFPLRGKKAGATCSKPACEKCATSVGENRDFCPPHARYHREHGLDVKLIAEGEDDFGGTVALDALEVAGAPAPQIWKAKTMAEWTEFYEERAAIGEFVGGISREAAERQALELAGPRPKK